jgi:hypothetical protein
MTPPPMGLRPFPPGGQPSWGGPARAEVYQTRAQLFSSTSMNAYS